MVSDVEEMRAEWPGWHVRCSVEGTWKATRRCRDLTDEEHVAGLAMTLMADSAEGLLVLLGEQQAIEAARAGGESA